MRGRGVSNFWVTKRGSLEMFNVASMGPWEGGYSLIWVIQVRAAGQGMVF